MAVLKPSLIWIPLDVRCARRAGASRVYVSAGALPSWNFAVQQVACVQHLTHGLSPAGAGQARGARRA
eukprot:12999281-Alexandrium_andersonii.AAC.1